MAHHHHSLQSAYTPKGNTSDVAKKCPFCTIMHLPQIATIRDFHLFTIITLAQDAHVRGMVHRGRGTNEMRGDVFCPQHSTVFISRDITTVSSHVLPPLPGATLGLLANLVLAALG